MIPTKASPEQAREPDETPEDARPEPPPEDPQARAHEAALRARLATRPVATMALLAAIAAVFGIELLLGGSSSIPVLNALGGLNHDAVFAGEVWRLASHSFLHASVVHIAMNGWVLYVIGQRVEQMLGTARLLVLYVAAVIGGGLVALFTSSAVVTVGASGGLFGLLAAESVFVFTSRSHLLPPMVRAARQRGAIINLLLNLGVSLQPNVSLSAHAGGALVGAALMLAGFAPAADDASTKAPALVRALAGLGTLVLGASLACGLFLSGAPGLLGEPTLARTSLPELGWSVELPENLAPVAETASDGGIVERAFGDIQRDPAVVAVARIARDQFGADADARAMDEIETALRTPPAQTTLEDVHRTTCGDRPAVVARYSYPSGVVLQRYFVVRTGELARIDTVAWPGFADTYLETAGRTAASITPL